MSDPSSPVSVADVRISDLTACIYSLLSLIAIEGLAKRSESWRRAVALAESLVMQ